jgi:hypothetical protein
MNTQGQQYTVLISGTKQEGQKISYFSIKLKRRQNLMAGAYQYQPL